MAKFVTLWRSARIRNRRFWDRDWGNVGLESLRSNLHDSVDHSTDPMGVLTVGKKTLRRRELRNRRRCRRVNVTTGTLNVMDGRGSRLAMACGCLARHGVDVAVVTEAKFRGFCELLATKSC